MKLDNFFSKIPFYKISEWFVAPKNSENDELYTLLKNNSRFRATQTFYGLGIMFYFASFVLIWIFYFHYEPSVPPEVIQVRVKDNRVEQGKLILLPTPRYTDEALRSWVIEAVNNIYNFSFLNYGEQLEKSEKYFSRAGFREFKNTLKYRQLNVKLQRNKQVQSLTVIGDVRMIGGNKGYFNSVDGLRYWQVKVPAVRRLTSGRTEIDYVMVEMIVILDTDNDGRSGFFINDISILGMGS